MKGRHTGSCIVYSYLIPSYTKPSPAHARRGLLYSVCPSAFVHHFLENRGSSGLQTWICYEVGCIDGKIRFWSAEARGRCETAGSRSECALIRDTLRGGFRLVAKFCSITKLPLDCLYFLCCIFADPVLRVFMADRTCSLA